MVRVGRMTTRVTCGILATLAVLGTVVAGDRMIHPEQAIPLFLKIITYDDGFRPDSLKGISVCLVYEESKADSYEQYEQSVAFFDKHPELKINGLPVKFRGVPYAQFDSLMVTRQKGQYLVLIITNLDDAKVRTIGQKTGYGGVHSFTFNPDHIPLGTAVGVEPADKKTAIVVNLPKSKTEGSRFNAHLLQMCKIYDGNP